MQALTLIHPEDFPISRYADVLIGESISSQSLDSLDHLASDGGSLRVVLVGPGVVTGRPRIDARTAIVGIGLSEQPRWLTDEEMNSIY